MPGSVKRITNDKNGQGVTMEAWRKTWGQDVHSVEITPEYPLTALEGKDGRFDRRSLTIDDFFLPRNSPLRTAGTGGGLIGLRWDTWREYQGRGSVR